MAAQPDPAGRREADLLPDGAPKPEPASPAPAGDPPADVAPAPEQASPASAGDPPAGDAPAPGDPADGSTGDRAGPGRQAPDPTAGPSAAERLRSSSLWRWRGPTSLVGAMLFAILGWLLVAGAEAFGGDDALANARPSDLVQLLDSLETENDRLTQEERRLQGELVALTSGTRAEALAKSQERLESLQVLAGTTPVRGPGVRIVIRDPAGGVRAADLLNAVQELRDAGAESIEVAQRRVVVNTWFADPPDEEPGGVLVSGDLRSSPYTILAIGDPATLETAMQIPGGVADSMRTAGADFTIDVRESLTITATVPLLVPDYAEPVAK